MKTSIKTALYLQVTALVLTTTFATSALAKKPLPFYGIIGAVESFEFDADLPIMHVDGSGLGKATQLGRYAVTYEFTVDLPTGDGVGSHQFTASDGDALFTESTANGRPTEIPNVNLVVEWHTVTGGTGRFEGVSGSFTLRRLVSLTTGVTFGSFSGTIVLDKKK